MLKHKKAAAFILSLALCAAAVSPVYSAFAEDESDETEIAQIDENEGIELYNEEEEAEAYEEEEADEEDDYITSGDYKYSLTSDGTVCIEGYIGSDTDITVPETLDGMDVTELGSLAFFETSAVSVHIPASITYISDNPFMESTDLKEITVDENNENYFSRDGILYLNRSGITTLLCYPQGKEDAEFTTPDDVTVIGAAAIYATKLKKLTFSENVNYVYRHAMSYNESLEVLDMSACTELTELGDMSAAGCTALTEILFPESLTSIGAGTFALCTSLTEVELPDALEEIGQNAFIATGLKKVIIPSSVTEIGYSAFGYDEELSPIDDFIVIGESGSAAETYATDTDDEYDYENNFTFIETSNADLIDESNNFDTITGDDYIYTIKDGEVYILSCLVTTPTIEIPSEIDGYPVTCIYGTSFYQNSASTIIIPDTVTRIGQLAFAGCTELTSITIPDSVTKIENQAFAGCSALETIEIPASCEEIGEEAFYGCISMKEYKVKDGSSFFTAEDGVLYSSDKTIIVDYPAAKSSKYYQAPDSAVEILTSAFAGSDNLENVDISTVITIGDYAFEDCSNLSSIKLAEGLETIGTCAFYSCTSLLAMRTYNSITEIDDLAIGYYYDSDNSDDALIDGFVLYADDDSGGSRYAYINGLECDNDVSKYTDAKAPAATFSIFGVNVEKSFVYAVSGIIGAVILAAVGMFTAKKIKSKKKDKNGKDMQ